MVSRTVRSAREYPSARASLAFGIPLQFERIYCEGISSLSSEDIGYAEELGYRIKHLGICRRTAEGIELLH